MAISNWTFINLIISIILCMIIPIVCLVFIRRQTKHAVGPFVAGILSFVVMQIFIRLPLLQLVTANITVNSWVSKIGFALALAFSAALFETTGRVASIHWLVSKKKRSYHTGLAHGVGHGGIEAALLVGVNYVVYLIIAIGLSRKGTESYLFQQFTQIEQDALIQIIVETKSYLFLVAGIERMLTLCFHVGMSLIIMEGFIKGRIGRGFFLVLVLHTTVDFAVVMLAYLGVSIGLIEGYIGIFALLSLGYIVIRKKSLEAEIITVDEGEEAVREGY